MLGKPRLVLFAPVCRCWCKVTDFASKSPAQMIKLVKERARQTALMSKVTVLCALVMSYGGHIMIENPTHSKFWRQDFMREITSIAQLKHPTRTFLLNRCRVGGIHFKQYKFFTTLPPATTDHMELECDHTFRHPPCLGRDSNGASVTKASGVYTKSMVMMIASAIAKNSGHADVVKTISN